MEPSTNLVRWVILVARLFGICDTTNIRNMTVEYLRLVLMTLVVHFCMLTTQLREEI